MQKSNPMSAVLHGDDGHVSLPLSTDWRFETVGKSAFETFPHVVAEHLPPGVSLEDCTLYRAIKPAAFGGDSVWRIMALSP